MPDGLELSVEALLPPFAATIPTALRIIGERALIRSRSLTRNKYSTERFLNANAERRTSLLKTIRARNGLVFELEAVSDGVECYSKRHELTLASDMDACAVSGIAQAALNEVLQPHYGLCLAVTELVWRCHVIVAEEVDYDVSFSDPEIPFSIFISVPTQNDRSSLLRVAENIVHETMHLQLSLFERCCPLIDTASTCALYSPWKHQQRPAQGILHGLYVFHVLRWMWQQIAQSTHTGSDRTFALRRICQIEREINAVRDLKDSPALTQAGNVFLGRLFDSERKQSL
jgi:HEXXH motif-containing protein